MRTHPMRLPVLSMVPAAGVVAVLMGAPWDAGGVAIMFGLAGLLFESFPARLTDEVQASLGPVAVMMAFVVHDLSAAIAVTLGGTVAMILQIERGQRIVKGPYNFGMYALATVVGWSAYSLVVGEAGGFVAGGDTSLGLWVLGLAVAMPAHYCTNLLLLSLAIRVTGGPPIRQVFTSTLRDGWWSQLLTVAFAFTGSVVYAEAGPGALLLLLVPLVIARRAMLGHAVQRESLDRAVRALVRLVEVKDEYTRGHAERVADLSDKVAGRMGLSSNERYWIRIGAVLHDVGKVGVPLEVLTKAGRLTDGEYWHMRRHPDLGADLLATVEALAPAVPLVRQHHERIDGCGYPRGMRGDQVPLATRIVSAVDSWDAMTTTRPYRTALPRDIAVRELVAHQGRQFDARVVVALLAIEAPDVDVEVIAAQIAAEADEVELQARTSTGHVHPQAHVPSPSDDGQKDAATSADGDAALVPSDGVPAEVPA